MKKFSIEKKNVFQTDNSDETELLGIEFSSMLNPGDVIALIGDLGTGKTTFTRGIIHGIGTKKKIFISSPSYTIISEYPSNIPVFHIDLFRLDENQFFDLNLEDYFTPQHITVIEWADKLPFTPEHLWKINFIWKSEAIRKIIIMKYRDNYY